MATTAPLPFRLQLLTSRGGVSIYDNGVSTETESTRSALATLARSGKRVHWLGGGKSKDGAFDALAEAVVRDAESAHLFGSSAEALAAAIDGRRPTTVHESLKQALAAAMATARPGDAVLFSPAFASFDQYPNFRARALEFHALLREQGAGDAAVG
jgi:UDP-N-acetylmuramoylalanine--D-glutamate ligase